MENCEDSRRKWNGAWWHMAALYEMGEVKQIPGPLLPKQKRYSKLKHGRYLSYPPTIIQQVKLIK